MRLLLTLGIVAGVVAMPADAAPRAIAASFEPGRVIVRFASGEPSRAALAAVAELDAQVARPTANGTAHLLHVRAGAELEAVARLRHHPDVELADVDRIIRHQPAGDGTVSAQLVPNDANYAGEQWNLKLIGMEDAWGVTTGASSVTVAVLDTGINASHIDFRDTSGGSRVLPGRNFKDLSQPTNVFDLVGHGTFVSGIIGALGNNGAYVAGMSWSVKLLPVKVFNDSLVASDVTVTDGLSYAVEQGARIVNLSICATEDLPLFRGAVESALAKGVLLVAPAGNIGTSLRSDQVCYPAAYSGVYAIAAVDHKSQRPAYSQKGAYVDLTAPGGSAAVPIVSTRGTTTGRDYGTSHSAPHVAGLAALMMAISPTIATASLVDIVNATATDLGPAGRDDEYGHGLINAAAALRALQSPALTATPAAVSFMADPSGYNGPVTLRVEASGRAVPYSISAGQPWLLVDGKPSTTGTTPATVTVSLALGAVPAGQTSTASLAVSSSALIGAGAAASVPVTVWHSTTPFRHVNLPVVFDQFAPGW